jgi:hypothetical protein
MRARAWRIVVLALVAVVGGGTAWFGAAPNAAAADGFQFSAAGDFGSWTGFRESLDQLNASGSDFALAVGDLSYGGNTGYAVNKTNSTEQAWCLKFQKFYKNVAIIAGNHDVGAPPVYEGDINNFTKYCPFPLKSKVVGEYGKQYYFDYPATSPLARFILISPDLFFVVDDGEHYSYDKGTPRYDWTKAAIDGARTAGIPWVIVAFHKNCIGAGEHDCETGPDILNLMLQEKVDLVLNAHEHDYERSHQLALNDNSCPAVELHIFNPGCIVHDGSDKQYQRNAGPVVVIQGTGGREFDTFNPNDPYAAYFATHMANGTVGAGHGVVTYNVYPDRIEMKTSFNGTYTDSFTIGDFTPDLFARFVQVFPLAAPIIVGFIGFGVGGVMVWRARKIGLRARNARKGLGF